MANTFFKSFAANDRTSSRTLLHEFIPITGTLMSGTYNASGSPERGVNIKTFSHGMFQSIYDYPYVSSSANHIFDISYGASSVSDTMGRVAQIDFSNDPADGASVTLTSLNAKETAVSWHVDGAAMVAQIDTDSIAAGGVATAFDDATAEMYVFRQPTKNRIYINKAKYVTTAAAAVAISNGLSSLDYYFNLNSFGRTAAADGVAKDTVGSEQVYNTTNAFVVAATTAATSVTAKGEFFKSLPLIYGSTSVVIQDASNSSTKSVDSVDTITLAGAPNISNTPSFSISTHVQKEKKENMYHQMAQILVGFDQTGTVRTFDQDGDFTGGAHHNECLFLTFSRLLIKDEIKKGTFSMQIGMGTYASPFNALGAHDHLTLTDVHVAENNGYKINSPAGEYAILKGIQPTTAGGTPRTINYGLIFYQAGVVVLSRHVLNRLTQGDYDSTYETSFDTDNLAWNASSYPSPVTLPAALNSGNDSIYTLGRTGNIDELADALRHRIMNIQFNNTTELNSTIYFCRANHNEFNYSSNPTFLKDSKLVVKGDNIMNPPRTYVTTVGLYSADNELLAVAKLSEPLRKDPSNELTLRVRLDY